MAINSPIYTTNTVSTFSFADVIRISDVRVKKIQKASERIQKEIQHALYAYSEVIAGLEQAALFPDLSEFSLVHELSRHVDHIEDLITQLRSHSIYDPGLKDYADEIDEDILMLADRFNKWTRRKTLSAKEAAELLGKSTSTIYRKLKKGDLIGQKIDGRWVIAADSVK